MNTDTSVQEALKTINYFMSPISVIMSTAMLVCCLQRKQMKIHIKLVAVLATSDLMYSLSYVMDFFTYEEDSFFCRLEGIMNSFFLILSISIATSIAVLHYKLSTLTPNFNPIKFFWIAVGLGLAISGIFSFGPLVTNTIVIRQNNGTCYEEYEPNDKLGNVLYFIYSNIPFFSAPVVAFIFYIKAVRAVKKISEILLKNISLEITTLFWYPAVLFITLMPMIIVTLMQYVLDDENDIMTVVSYVCVTSIGVVNAITYGFQRNIYKRKMKSMEADNLKDHLPLNVSLPLTSMESFSKNKFIEES